MAKARLLSLSNSRKSSKTTSISESFDDILMDITEEPEPVPRCETPYDIHRKPEEFKNQRTGMRSFKRHRPDVVLIDTDEDAKLTTELTTDTTTDVKLTTDTTTTTTVNPTTVNVKRTTVTPTVNVGKLSLPNRNNWMSSRSNSNTQQNNVPMDILAATQSAPNQSHLKKPHVNPMKIKTCSSKTDKRQPICHDSDVDSDFELESKKNKVCSKRTTNALSFYGASALPTIDLKSVQVPALKRRVKAETEEVGSSSEVPVCLSDDESVTDVHVEKVTDTRMMKSRYQLRSAPTLSGFRDWNVIDISGLVSEIYFGQLTAYPLLAEFRSNIIDLAMHYRDDNVKIILTYDEIDVIEVNLRIPPYAIIIHLKTPIFKRERMKILSKFKPLKYWNCTECYVALKIGEKPDLITSGNLDELFEKNGKFKQIKPSDVEDFLQERGTPINSDNSGKKDIDIENPLPYSTRSRNKQAPPPPPPPSLVPVLNIASDTVVLKYCAKAIKTELSITGSDMQCLQDGEYLNDKIINFYLMYLWDSLAEKQDNVHMFNSFFYSQLTNTKKSDDKLKTPERFHVRVKSWTKKINIFDKTLTIVPVNYRQHWFLAVIVRPCDFDPSAVPPKRVSKRKSLQSKSKKSKRPKQELERVTENITDTTEDITEDTTENTTENTTEGITESITTEDTTEDITEDITGDTTGDITGDITEDITGDITENVSRDDVTTDFDQCIISIESDQATNDGSGAIEGSNGSVNSEYNLLEAIATEQDNKATDSEVKTILDNDTEKDIIMLEKEEKLLIDETMEDKCEENEHENLGKKATNINSEAKTDDAEKEKDTIMQTKDEKQLMLDEIMEDYCQEIETPNEVDTSKKELKPGILVLDSMLIRRRTVGVNLRNYLTQEHFSKYQSEKDFEDLPVVFPEAPGQTNGYDCGVYLLTYTQSLLELPLYEEWAPHKVVSTLRKKIQDLILSLSPLSLDDHLSVTNST